MKGYKFDWDTIKREYITTSISAKELSRKYGCASATLFERARRDGWKEEADAYKAELLKTASEAVKERIVEATVENADQAQRILQKLLIKVEASVDMVNVGDAGAVKQLTQAMKDLRDIGAYETDKKDANIVIELKGDLESYAE